MKTAHIRYIVVHSTKSIPGSIPFDYGFDFLITSDGETIRPGRPILENDCISVAYTGGLDEKGKPANTLNERQGEVLFELLVRLSAKYKNAVLRGANELYKDPRDTGFDFGEWLKSYTPKVIRDNPLLAA